MVEHIAATLTPDFRSLEGDRVLEIKPAACTKGTAIEAFLREPPFVGRLPVFIGDDVTDRDGFSVVERNGGMSIAVGDRVQARWKLPSPAAVRSWLASFVQAGGH